MTTRIIAIDWSGDKRNARKKICLVEAINGNLSLPQFGRDWHKVTDYLIEEKEKDKHAHFVVGLDFAFSFPLKFLDECHLHTAERIWGYVREEGERWLEECPPPFSRSTISLRREGFYRKTELEVRKKFDESPKSVFQIGGKGQVGTGSIRGMPCLLRLRQAGFSIWPFHPLGFPLVVEIYPRLLTGRIAKSNLVKRQEYLRQYPQLSKAHCQLATESEDAFDATISALAMMRHCSAFDALADETDRQILLEGAIWYPDESRKSPN